MILLCHPRHRWTKWAAPFTPEGFRETIFVQRRHCTRCGAVDQRVVGIGL